MTKHVKIGKQGVLALPADLLVRKGWETGTELDLEETSTGFTVRSSEPVAADRPGFDYEAFRRDVPKHEGPAVSIEEMNKAIEIAMAERWARKEANSR